MRTLLILTALVVAVPQDDADKFWKFTKGTTWTYVGADGAIVRTVTEVMKDEIRFEIKTLDTMSSEIGKKTTGAFQLKKGLIIQAAVQKGKVEPLVAIWKPGAKEGEKWDLDGKITTKFVGLQDVTVPAGTYAQAITVEYTIGDVTTKLFMSPGVGVVQMNVKTKDKPEVIWTLKEFKPGK